MSNNTELAPIRVMLVDDSAVVRGFITRMLEKDPEIKVVYSAQNGQIAVNAVKTQNPDLLLLDVEMPVMDGLTAIPLLLEQKPDLRIVMCSTLTTANAHTTIKAMSLGAIDCVAKPSTTSDIYSQDTFRDILINKIKSIMAGSRRKSAAEAGSLSLAERNEKERTESIKKPSNEAPYKPASLHPNLNKEIILRKPSEGYAGKPEIIAIGSSTGGPNALFKVLPFCKGFDIPIVITQHMPPTFTQILAEHISQQCQLDAIEAQDGMKLEGGKIYVAQGGLHMLVQKTGSEKIIKLDDGPMENFCRPAVDPMLRSLVSIYGEKILTVILTGMGQDGMRGAKDVVEKGGRVVGQDEKTSVVWGMPGAVALAGLCSAVLPINEIGPYIQKAVMRI
jgi:two-component system, chemotaxis family, protein-glutamate methylesterase/glutaminase